VVHKIRWFIKYRGLHHGLQTYHTYGVRNNESHRDDMFVGTDVNRRKLTVLSFSNFCLQIWWFIKYRGLHHGLQTYHTYGVRNNESHRDDMIVGTDVNRCRFINPCFLYNLIKKIENIFILKFNIKYL